MLISALPFHEASHDEEQRGPRRYLKENLRGHRNLLLGVDLERLGAAPASQGSVHRLLSRCGMPRHGGEAENLARRPPSGASSSRRRGLQAPPSPSLPTPFSLLPRPRGMNTNGEASLYREIHSSDKPPVGIEGAGRSPHQHGDTCGGSTIRTCLHRPLPIRGPAGPIRGCLKTRSEWEFLGPTVTSSLSRERASWLLRSSSRGDDERRFHAGGQSRRSSFHLRGGVGGGGLDRSECLFIWSCFWTRAGAPSPRGKFRWEGMRQWTLPSYGHRSH